MPDVTLSDAAARSPGKPRPKASAAKLNMRHVVSTQMPQTTDR